MTTAFMIIDVQSAILDGLGGARQAEHDAALAQVVSRLAAVKHRAHSANIPVIIVQHDGAAGHRLEAGTAGWAIHPDLAPTGTDTVIRKRYSDSFKETDLQETLTTMGIDHLIVGGCMTQFCVNMTTHRAMGLGYAVTYLTDGHMTADMGDLRFEQIVDHYSAVFTGFSGDPGYGLNVARTGDVLIE